ncbi:hypothetical protein GCM10011519_23100 [Marmoricola endophyticus]|uniref:Bacterial proteasome activator n=1 Tax=Marmoricola endophyticus TaxID=2040280 RepID=A0A917F380_9ACTN|nr:bacterial proteasome activator family protein [Marmoricola endophyticus]GGF48467.1 hypothetical protein GCM10011519_23100 [Marmoricola endophyticus]
MSEQTPDEGQRIVVVGPDGRPVSAEELSRVTGQDVERIAELAAQQETPEDGGEDDGRGLTDLVEQPAKVMRIGSMIRQLLEEVKAAPLDDAGRTRLAGILHTSLDELKDGLAPELDEELTRLVAPFEDEIPSESELRVAQAQLVGWLEGLFHGIQTAIYAQQMAARAQLEQMRRALPAGQVPGMQPGMPGQQPGAPGQPEPDEGAGRGGMYL